MIAGELADRRRAHPDQFMTLVGFSGGGGLAVLVAERLPADAPLDRLILISAALSPDYDLAGAESHVRGRVLSFYSRGDWLILGAGTSTLGTIDRKKTRAAGHVGFQNAAGEVIQSDKLTQIPWAADWIKYGHYGGHGGWLSGPWARNVLAQYLSAGPISPSSAPSAPRTTASIEKHKPHG